MKTIRTVLWISLATVALFALLGGSILQGHAQTGLITISGTLTNIDGQPISGASVRIFRSNGSGLISCAITNTAGEFSCQQEPGDYGFLISRDYNSPVSPNAPTNYQLSSVSSYLTIAQDTNLSFVFPARKIHVRVVDTQGDPIANVSTYTKMDFPNWGMYTYDLGYGIIARASANYGSSDVSTDVDGWAHLWLTPGRYNIYARPTADSTYGMARQEINVGMTDELTLSITLDNKVKLSGKVFVSDTWPLYEYTITIKQYGFSETQIIYWPGIYEFMVSKGQIDSIEVSAYKSSGWMTPMANSFWMWSIEPLLISDNTEFNLSIPLRSVIIETPNVVYNNTFDFVTFSTSQPISEAFQVGPVKFKGKSSYPFTYFGDPKLPTRTKTSFRPLFLLPGTYEFFAYPMWDWTTYGSASVIGEVKPEGITTIQINLPILNQPPIANAGGPYTVDEGSMVTMDASLSTDPDGDPLTYEWDLNNDGVYGDATGMAVQTSFPDNGQYLVSVRVTDPSGAQATALATVNVMNVAPTVVAGDAWSLNESENFISWGFFSDPGADSWSATVDYGDGSGPEVLGLGAWGSFDLNHVYADNGTYPVQVCITDDDGGQGCDTVLVQVANLPPQIQSLGVSKDLALVGTTVSGNATFTDPGWLDTHTAVWDWGDGTTSAGQVNGYEASENHAYTKPGLYTVTITVTDDDGGSASETYQYVVVYDPNAGFVTGGGWIKRTTNKAIFEFDVKYLKGTKIPTGSLVFQSLGDKLIFASTKFDWLVVKGTTVWFKGEGKLNGVSGYAFLVAVTDGTPDKFRIKIWDMATGTVIYDNMLGAADDASPSTVLGGGSIVIHK